MKKISSDPDVAVEYKGDIRENTLFDVLHEDSSNQSVGRKQSVLAGFHTPTKGKAASEMGGLFGV